MSIPGYDLEDLDRILLERLGDRGLSDVLTAEQLARYEAGESLVDVMDEETASELLGTRKAGG
ncbi:hypothetical protein [Halomarina litorea]|uniref:hypothetical protein n=1 Tax=Halomarina litorea TaxID=2961595 RepID=UPI0020C3A7FA|nr:hypothetical protein [Halomarina sp. BCD28]